MGSSTPPEIRRSGDRGCPDRRRVVCRRSGLRPSLRHTTRTIPQLSHEHWTGSRTSCRRRLSTGIALTGCSRRTTSSGPPSPPSQKGNVGKRRDAATDGHAVGGYAAGGDAAADCCDSCDKPPSHDTSRIAWAKLMARVGEEFPVCVPLGVVATSDSEETAGRSRLPSNRRFASGRRPGWLRPREVSPWHIAANRSPLRFMGR